jgi:septal ring factor EnvC (AmiA/AmiB activator)
VALLPVLALLLAGVAGADSLDARLEAARIRLEVLQSRDSDAREVLLALHEHLAAARDYYNELVLREAGITMAIDQLNDRWMLADSARSILEEGLGDYLVYLYSQRSRVSPALLFSRGGVQTLVRRRVYLDHLARRAATQVEILTQSGDSLAQFRDSLETLRESVRSLRMEMEELQERIYREEESQALLRMTLRDEISAAAESAAVLEAQRRELSALVADLRVSSRETGGAAAVPVQPGGDSYFERMRGALSWPGRGSVVRRFGVERDPVYGTETVCDGVSVATAPGETVRALAGGSVVFSREFMSLGRMVVLDHRDGWYSIYGHLGNLQVARGDSVSQGSALGAAGPLPGGRPGYYLEMRKGAEPVDPLVYLEPLR